MMILHRAAQIVVNSTSLESRFDRRKLDRCANHFITVPALASIADRERRAPASSQVVSMTIIARLTTRNHPLYTVAELTRMRRLNLRSARMLQPGPERNQRRQVAASIKSLLSDSDWVHANTLDWVLIGESIDTGRQPRQMPLSRLQ
jgi:hypothetical protein